MTHELTEQVIREQLHAAVEAESDAYLDVDPLVALDTGRRIRQRRRVTAVASTAAAALVVGIGAWSVLSDRAGDDRTLPAVTSSVAGPSVTLPLGTDPGADTTDPLDVVVTVDKDHGKVEFRLKTDSGEVLNAQVRSETDGQVTWTTLSEGAMVAVVPAGATGVVPRYGDDVTSLRTAAAALPDGRVAAAWLTDRPDAGTRFAGVVWTDGTNAFNVEGTPLVSTVVDGDIVVFTGTGVEAISIGYIRLDPGSLIGSGEVRAWPLYAPYERAASVWVPDRSGGGGVYVAHLQALEERFAEQVSLETTPEATVRDVKLYRPHQVFLLVAHIDGPPGSVTAVTYPGGDGR